MFQTKLFEKCAGWILYYIVQDGMSQNKPLNENEMQMEILGDEISNESIRRLTIMLSSWLVFTLIVSWLFASMEVGV